MPIHPLWINKKNVQRNFSAAAANYDRVSGLQREVSRLLLSCLPVSFCGAARVLDIGTGTGLALLDLAASFPDSEFHGLDISYGMIRQALRTATRAPTSCALSVANRMFFLQADAERLPYCSSVFDLALSNLTYQWVADHGQAFGEVCRILKPGGKFAFSTFGQGTLAELHTAFRQACRKLKGEEAPPQSHGQEFLTLGELEAVLRDCGFSRLKVRECALPRIYPDVRSLLMELKATGASNATLSRSAGLGGRKVLQEMQNYYEQHFHNGQGILATYQVILVQGEKIAK
ncbi:MAG: malonyl-ACP O-methyltransferase BioC [bacterium]